MTADPATVLALARLHLTAAQAELGRIMPNLDLAADAAQLALDHIDELRAGLARARRRAAPPAGKTPDSDAGG